MKILIFSVAYHPFVGGAEIAVKEITDRLKDIEFHLVTVNLDGRQKKEEKLGNVFVHRVGGVALSGIVGKILFPFTGAKEGLRLHNIHNFDASWSIMAAFAGFAALFFKYLRPKVPFFLTLQEGDSISHIKRRVWFIYPLFLQIFRRADRIQAISNYLADFAKSLGTKAPIEVIPNGVDVSLFSRDYPEQVLDNLKATFGKRGDDIFLVTTSRLVFKNGISYVIRALDFLPANVKFLVIGTGPFENRLKRLAKNLGVADRVKFLGFIPHSELPKYLKISDIFIRHSLSEGMGNSFLEAMAAGVPVIATNVGGIPDFLKDRETGLFCNLYDHQSVAEKIYWLMFGPNLKSYMISNAQKMVQKKYDWSLIAGDMRQRVFLAQNGPNLGQNSPFKGV